MDGVKINVRGEGWKELKVGCVFDIEMRPEPNAQTEEIVEHAHAVNNSDTAHLGEPAPFDRALWAEACRREMPHVRDSVVPGDGASWIWNLAGEHFASSRQVVDWYHATEHLYKAAHLAYGEGSAEAIRWAKGMETPWYPGHAWKIGVALRELAKHHRRVATELRAEAGYFEHHQRRMQYLEMREEGFPIGSGMVESGGKQFRALGRCRHALESQHGRATDSDTCSYLESSLQ